MSTAVPRVITDESLTFNCKFPPILALSCCSQTLSACFRVEFIDADCRICDVMICNTNAVSPTTSEEPAPPQSLDRPVSTSEGKSPKLSVYPNPNNGNFVINTSEIGVNCLFQLMTFEGREVQKGTISGERYELNNAQLQAGTYSLFVFKENRVFTEKIIVIKN